MSVVVVVVGGGGDVVVGGGGGDVHTMRRDSAASDTCRFRAEL